MSTWQPIATAPKDGKARFDLWVRGYHKGTDTHVGYRVTDCSWDSLIVAYGIRERGRGWVHFHERLDRYAWVERNDEDSTATVTHWMPVPDPPE